MGGLLAELGRLLAKCGGLLAERLRGVALRSGAGALQRLLAAFDRLLAGRLLGGLITRDKLGLVDLHLRAVVRVVAHRDEITDLKAGEPPVPDATRDLAGRPVLEPDPQLVAAGRRLIALHAGGVDPLVEDQRLGLGALAQQPVLSEHSCGI